MSNTQSIHSEIDAEDSEATLPVRFAGTEASRVQEPPKEVRER
ncbi:MAG: hypothetical protein ACI8VE_000884 [Natrialbaceae archaeon]|jgi:hypothetical protein